MKHEVRATKLDWDKKTESAPAGFLFNCTPGHVNKPRPLSVDEVKEIPAWCGNDDRLFLRCKTCDMMMIFTDDLSEKHNGKWACQGCGRVVHEKTPYNVFRK